MVATEDENLFVTEIFEENLKKDVLKKRIEHGEQSVMTCKRSHTHQQAGFTSYVRSSLDSGYNTHAPAHIQNSYIFL